jgi:hypothetical protein
MRHAGASLTSTKKEGNSQFSSNLKVTCEESKLQVSGRQVRFQQIFHNLQHVPKLNDFKSPTDTDSSCVSSNEEKQETKREIPAKKR